MKRWILTLLVLLVTTSVTCWVTGQPAAQAAGRRAATSTHIAIAFDMSQPLAAMEQFIPDKPLVIHPAAESVPEREGSIEGPGAGLGATPPTPPAARGGAGAGGRGARGATGARGGTGGSRAGGGAAAIPGPPPAPEIKPAGAAVEQTVQGKRAPIQPLVAFDALGEGFTGREYPGAADAADTPAGRGGGRGGIDISLGIGPDHIFEVLGGNFAVFTKKGKKFDASGSCCMAQ